MKEKSLTFELGHLLELQLAPNVPPPLPLKEMRHTHGEQDMPSAGGLSSGEEAARVRRSDPGRLSGGGRCLTSPGEGLCPYNWKAPVVDPGAHAQPCLRPWLVTSD